MLRVEAQVKPRNDMNVSVEKMKIAGLENTHVTDHVPGHTIAESIRKRNLRLPLVIRMQPKNLSLVLEHRLSLPLAPAARSCYKISHLLLDVHVQIQSRLVVVHARKSEVAAGIAVMLRVTKVPADLAKRK